MLESVNILGNFLYLYIVGSLIVAVVYLYLSYEMDPNKWIFDYVDLFWLILFSLFSWAAVLMILIFVLVKICEKLEHRKVFRINKKSKV